MAKQVQYCGSAQLSAWHGLGMVRAMIPNPSSRDTKQQWQNCSVSDTPGISFFISEVHLRSKHSISQLLAALPVHRPLPPCVVLGTPPSAIDPRSADPAESRRRASATLPSPVRQRAEGAFALSGFGGAAKTASGGARRVATRRLPSGFGGTAKTTSGEVRRATERRRPNGFGNDGEDRVEK